MDYSIESVKVCDRISTNMSVHAILLNYISISIIMVRAQR